MTGDADYLDSLQRRLDAAGFEESLDGPAAATATFHDRSLSLTKFGFVDTFVSVACVDDDIGDAERFSEATFRHGLDNKSALPRGFGGNLVVYPVLVADGPRDLTRWVDTYEPSHWAAFEFPVVVDPDAGAFWYGDDTPAWGWIYYRGFRTFAEETLAPQSEL